MLCELGFVGSWCEDGSVVFGSQPLACCEIWSERSGGIFIAPSPWAVDAGGADAVHFSLCLFENVLERFKMSSPIPPKLPPKEYQGDRLIATAIAFIILDTVFVALRIWSRRLQQTKYRYDELFVIAGLVFILATCANCICMPPLPPTKFKKYKRSF
jgi:hypothetical protein